MKSKIIYAFWGIVLLVAGGAMLAGFDFEHLSPQVKVAFFAAASAAFFATYFVDGIKKWGWLFPALTCGALALIIGLDFVWADTGDLDAQLLFGAVALPFFVGYAVEPRHWGLLIPANIMLILMVFLAFADNINGPSATTLVLFAAAVPFLALYLLKRSRRWALVVAAIVAAVGTLSLLGRALNLNAEIGAVVVFTLLALPFAVVAIVAKENWWAIIPAGTFGSFALTAVVEALVPHTEYPTMRGTLSWDVYIWVLFVGLAATFAVVWLRYKAHGWAGYVAGGWLAVAILSYLQGIRFAEFWAPSAMLVTGGMFLVAIVIRIVQEAREPGLHGHA